MVRITVVKGKLANSTAEMIVCPVDCQGAAARAPSWGAARSMRRRFAAVFAAYAAECKRGAVAVGWVHGYQLPVRDRARMRKGTGVVSATRVIVLVAVKEHARDRVRADDVDVVLSRVREIVEGEGISSVSMAALGYEPDGASWDDTWPALETRLGAAFGDMADDVRIEVHAPLVRRSWPAGCPSVSQLRAARVLSGWGVRELAAASELSPTSVCQIENRVNELPRKPTLEAMRRALEGRGVEFGSDGWVRLADDQGIAVEGAASLTADACARALEHVERARRVLRHACAGSRAARSDDQRE